MSKLLYFAYGSNLHPLWLRSRTPSAKIVGMGSLPGYSLHFNKPGLDNSGKCNILRCDKPGSLVHGVVYEFHAHEKAVLDEAERGYEEDMISIGQNDNVLVYIADDFVDGHASPYSWYRDIVVAGARFHDFPGDYIDYISSFSVISDPDMERDLRHRTIVGLR